VHWIDKATEEVVGAVVEAMAALPLLLVLVYRPEYLHAWAGRAYHAQITLSGLVQTGGVAMVRAVLTKPYTSQVSLAPLPLTQRTAMARALLGTAAIPPEVEQLIVSKTEGNPLFIEELTRSLLESFGLRPHNYTGRSGRPASRWEHGIVTAEVAADPRLSGVLTRPVALQLRWQYLQRIRSDYRAYETISAMTAQTSVGLAEHIIASVEGYLHAEHP
jgi:hypothetical protein